MEPSARVIADSVTSAGDRLTTLEVVMHRFVLAEANTHRVWSRNSASSRAIPAEKMLARFAESPAWPLEWPAEQAGMQGGAELSGQDLADAQDLLARIHGHTAEQISAYLAEHPEKPTRLHKSLLNRPTEWAQWHVVVVTSTAWENYFAQRCSPLAQPEIRVPSEIMRAAVEASEPRELADNEWHLPYVQDDERDEFDNPTLIRLSTARCARTSYLTQNGLREINEDLGLYDRLREPSGPPHYSPMEHPARPAPQNKHDVTIESEDLDGSKHALTVTLPRYGNFLGYHQHRFDVEAAQQYQSFA